MSDRMEVEAGPLDGDEVARRIVAVGMAVSQAAEELKEAAEVLLAEEEQVKRAALRARAAEERIRQAEVRAAESEDRVKQAVELIHAAEDEAKQAAIQVKQAEYRAQTAEDQARQAVELLEAAEAEATQAEKLIRQAESRAQATEDAKRQAELRSQAAEEEARQAELRAHAAEEQNGELAQRLQVAENEASRAATRLLAAETQERRAELRAQAAEEQARDVAERLRAAEGEASQAAARLLVAESQAKQADIRMQAVEEQAAQTAAKNVELIEHLQQARGEYAGVEQRARTAEERLQAESERARVLDEQLKELKARLAEAKSGGPVAVVVDKERSALQDAVAAEVRRPLTSILGITLALKHHDPDSRDGPEMVRQLTTNARKLDRMVSVLLELDRLADGSLKPNRRRTDLKALVRRVAEDSPDLANRNVHVEAEKVVVAVDPSMTEQMVETLLANAGRRTSSGNPVWITIWSDPEGAVIAVDDTGPDVPEGLRKALAASSMDQRAGARRGRTPTGLTVLSRLAEVHGGRAWVEEREGGGTSFRVFLPDVLDPSDGLAAGGPGFAALARHDGAADETVTI